MQQELKKRFFDMDKKLTELTRGEEEIMQILWRLGDVVVNEIIAQTKEPRPKYTTVATFLKILENKGFVNHTPEGKPPLLSGRKPRRVRTRGHVVGTVVLFRRLAGTDGFVLLAP